MSAVQISGQLDDESILKHHEWSFPVPIAYGPGRLAEIGDRLHQLGVTNPLIVTDHGSLNLPFMALLADHLDAANLPHGLFGDISPNPRDDEIEAGCTHFRDGGHDAVIAIGGGSAMDGGKSICLTALNDVPLWDFEYSREMPDLPASSFPQLITIPTTAGTGAETESTAMVTHVERGMKFCIWHPNLKPALALLDPSLTVGLPSNLTAWTGVDALTHAMEAYLVPGFDPLCDGMALEGLFLISRWLPVAVQEPANMAARGGMLMGSCLAGIAFLKGLGLVHAISHMVGAEYNTQHGLTNAITLPVVMRYNLPDQQAKMQRMAAVMNAPSGSIEAFCGHVESLLDDLDIPRGLGEIGVPLDCAQRIAEKAVLDSAAGTNPKPATIAEIRELVETAISAAR